MPDHAHVQFHNCWTANCRNELNGCAYQYYAFQAADQCGISNIEKFPVPRGAPGDCSCPIGQVLEDQSYYFVKMDDCFNFADKDDAINCLCCAYSGSISAYYELCPGYDADDSDIINATSSILFALDINFPGWKCPGDYHRCHTVYGMVDPPSGKYLNVDSRLPSGTLSPTIISTTKTAKSTTKHSSAKTTTKHSSAKTTSTHKTVKTAPATSAHHSSKATKTSATTHRIAKTTIPATTRHPGRPTKV
ncbi:hypothetical protein V1525DRAFT_220619 [Lipomyces kononenkoae]|uniref:Uncharacterized protein n=1 Tax=Lipomyces kononenkoae TaxID=34357 RepID=A0ACC3SY76_LIPKO